jgi:hypothetical protein
MSSDGQCYKFAYCIELHLAYLCNKLFRLLSYHHCYVLTWKIYVLKKPFITFVTHGYLFKYPD